jgi:hypothetical protein
MREPPGTDRRFRVAGVASALSAPREPRWADRGVAKCLAPPTLLDQRDEPLPTVAQGTQDIESESSAHQLGTMIGTPSRTGPRRSLFLYVATRFPTMRVCDGIVSGAQELTRRLRGREPAHPFDLHIDFSTATGPEKSSRDSPVRWQVGKEERSRGRWVPQYGARANQDSAAPGSGCPSSPSRRRSVVSEAQPATSKPRLEDSILFAQKCDQIAAHDEATHTPP